MLFVRCTITFRVRYVLTGLLALRSYAAPLLVESQARLRICISRVSYLCVLNDSGFDFLFFFVFSHFYGFAYSPSGMGLFARPALL
jgi:hypothetical protein